MSLFSDETLTSPVNFVKGLLHSATMQRLVPPRREPSMQRDQRKRLEDLLCTLVPEGALAFDIGAGAGHMTATLLRLGCSVVAVEPHPYLARALRRRYPSVRIIEAAVVPRSGITKLRTGADLPASTTVSPSDDLEASSETAVLRVNAVSLDLIIAQSGMPDLISLDVNGAEADALAGLSTAPDLLVAAPPNGPLETLTQSIARLDREGRYRFTFVDVSTRTPWFTRDELATLERRSQGSSPPPLLLGCRG